MLPHRRVAHAPERCRGCDSGSAHPNSGPSPGPSMSTLSHFDAKGSARMVDVSEKSETARVAVATATVLMAKTTLELVLKGRAKKGDVLSVARLAGIMAAKRTPDL